MTIPLSPRLRACAAFVRPGARVADICCDHGHLGLYLLQAGIASQVYAADIAPLPLQNARKNAEKLGLSNQIQFFLSDGVLSLPRDFDTLLCAGVGADTIISILGAAPWLRNGRCLIVQCQSQRVRLARWLSAQGYRAARETVVQEGKFFYPVAELSYAPGAPLSPGECYLSPALRASGAPALAPYYRRILANLETTLHGLSRGGDAQALAFYTRAWEELQSWKGEILC